MIGAGLGAALVSVGIPLVLNLAATGLVMAVLVVSQRKVLIGVCAGRTDVR